MLPSFLTPRVDLLTGDGRLTPLREGPVLGRPRVLLGRELCAFEWLAPRGAGASAGLAAARLHARASAPYLRAGSLVRRAGEGFAVWSWDLDAIEPMLAVAAAGARPVFAPETLAQPRGEGWRIVRTASGDEAQLWRQGALVASSWRKTRFTPADWAAFTRVRRDADDAPPAPPAAQDLPLTPSAAFGGVSLGDMTPRQAAGLAAGVAIVAVASAAAFQLGEGVRHRERAQAAEQALAALRPAPSAAGPGAERRRLQAYADLTGRPGPLLTLGVALDVLRRHGIRPEGFEADGQALVLTLPYAAIDRIEPLTADLQATGLYGEVRPSTLPNRGGLELRLSVLNRGAGSGRPGRPGEASSPDARP